MSIASNPLLDKKEELQTFRQSLSERDLDAALDKSPILSNFLTKAITGIGSKKLVAETSTMTKFENNVDQNLAKD